MTSAVLTDYSEIISRLPAGSEIILREQSFEDYQEILESVGEAGGLRVSFNGEKVKIITLTTEHEKYVRFIEMLTTVLSMRKRIKVLSFGSATMKSSRRERGSEPDCCFYVQNAERVANLETVDFSRDLPPDIVVEIDIYHSSTDKFDIYSKLEVPEFWLYDGERMKIYKLDGGNYSEVENSPALAVLSGQILSDFLRQLKSSDQYEVLLQFENWLENQE